MVKKLMRSVIRTKSGWQSLGATTGTIIESLLKYHENPTQEDAVRLEQRFAELFETKTDYEALDERIAKTRAKKAGLLAVLRHPEVPLHNNASELGARARVRKRAASLVRTQRRESVLGHRHDHCRNS